MEVLGSASWTVDSHMEVRMELRRTRPREAGPSSARKCFRYLSVPSPLEVSPPPSLPSLMLSPLSSRLPFLPCSYMTNQIIKLLNSQIFK